MVGREASGELLPAVRQARILELVRQEGATSIQRLAFAVGASLSTIRRDLDSLTEGGLGTKVTVVEPSNPPARARGAAR